MLKLTRIPRMNLSPSCLLTMELLSCLLLGRLPTSSQKELNQNLKGRFSETLRGLDI